MTDQIIVRDRRERVAEYLSHHIISPVEIKKELEEKFPGVNEDIIYNDIKVIKKSSSPWLVGLAKTGYVYDVMLGVKKLKAHERELEEMKKLEGDWEKKRAIIKQIDETLIARLSLEGEGPVFLAISSRKV